MVPHYPPFLELFQKCQQSPDVLTFDLHHHRGKLFVRVSAAQTFKGVFGQ